MALVVSIYKDASRRKLRFTTNRGVLSVDQLWDLKEKELDELIRKQHNLIKGSEKENDELSFLSSETIKEDSDEKLRFNILVDIYMTKKAERENQANELEKKRRNAQIDEIIARKQNQALENMSIEELMKLRES